MRHLTLILAGAALALGCAGLGDDGWDDLPEAPRSANPPAAAAPAPAAAAPAKTAAKSTAKKAAVGQIDLATKAGVLLRVDGAPAVFDIGRGSYVADVSPGAHHVEIENIAGKIVAETHVDVPANKRVRLRYRTGGELTDLGTANDLVY